MSNPESQQLSGLVDKLVEQTDGDKVTIGELIESIDSRSFGPLLLLGGLLAASPLGMVPGMSIFTGSIIVIVAGQLLFGRSTPWLPKKLLELKFDRQRLANTRKKLRPWLRWAERPIQARLVAIVQPPFEQVVAAICILLAATFFPLSVVPFAVFLPAAAICFFALGLSARDGLLTLFAFILTGGTLWAAIVYWPF